MRYDHERQILAGLRGFVQDIISDAISGISARGEGAPALRPTSDYLQLSPMQARIVDAVRGGHRTIPEIASEIGSTAGSVRAQAARLARAGILERKARGVYRVPSRKARSREVTQ